jgi:hypothetical protein
VTNSVSKHYLTYWKSYSLQDALLQEKPIRFIWSQQFAPVNAGDTLWIAGSLLNRFLCLGSITVKRVFERDGRWTIEAETPLHPRIVDLTTMWKHSLTFESDARLTTTARTLPDGKQLQRLRRLSKDSANWLQHLYP